MHTSKSMTNRQISELLRNVALAHQITDEEKYKFQIIAYNRVADSVEHATSELKDLWDDGKLNTVPGIGKSISRHLDEIFRTGKSKHFENIFKGIDPKIFKLTELPGIGIKTATKLIKEAPKAEIEAKLKEVKRLKTKNQRLLLPYAENIASDVMKWLLRCSEVEKADVLGSVRRKNATVGDIDILIVTKNADKSINQLINYPKKQKIIEKGDRTASILLPNNVQVDLLISDNKSYGSAMQHFTGSKHHNIALREYARKKGFSLNEYGITNLKTKKIKRFDNEKNFYAHIGLDYIEPELREGVDEVAVSKNHDLPKLVNLKDIKGDLHIHSDYDVETSHDLGMSSAEDIIKKANELGYEYIALTEHNPSRTKHTDKEIVEILKRKREKVDKINYSISKTNIGSVKFVFNSLEIDIAPTGGVNIPEKAFEYLDFALVSVHSSFNLSKEIMTKRIISALSYPKVKIFAHPTARKINQREGIEINWLEVFEYCKKNKKFLEINAEPTRLDLPDVLVRDAVKTGVKLSIGTDSHHMGYMNNMCYGVYVARRGWCEKRHVINTFPLIDLINLISN